MSWSPCPEDHVWKPFPLWWGRYKCDDCHVIGYKGIVIGPYSGKPAGTLTPYLCPKCHGPTTKYEGGRARPCLRCRK